jgi:protein-S-isoprenylcysteine O-methyltransferase Ste14
MAMDLGRAVRDPWVWGQTGLMLLILIAAPVFPRFISLGAADFLLNRIDPNRIRVLGGGLLVAGVVLLSWGVRSLGSSLTPGIEPLTTGRLVTHGAYAHTRHPIYTGLVLCLAGYTLAWSNWTLAMILGGIALLYFDAKARAEEERMLARFPGYQAYMVHVRRRVL